MTASYSSILGVYFNDSLYLVSVSAHRIDREVLLDILQIEQQLAGIEIDGTADSHSTLG